MCNWMFDWKAYSYWDNIHMLELALLSALELNNVTCIIDDLK